MQWPLSSDPYYIWIIGVYNNSRNVLRFGQTEMLPRLARIGRFINTITVRCHDPSWSVLAHTYINRIWMAFRNGNSTHRTCFEMTIRDIFPLMSRICGFPNTTPSDAHVVGERITHNSCTRIGTPPSKGSDTSKFEWF